MAAVVLSDQDKARVRDLTEEAISLGKSAAELTTLRNELSTELKVGRRSLGSVSAYVEYSATQALDGEAVAAQIGNRELITVARLLRESATRSADLAILADDLGVAPAELDRVVNCYDSLLRQRPGGGDAVETETGSSPVLIPAKEAEGEAALEAGPNVELEAQDAEVSAGSDPALGSLSVRGDTANYDFLEKVVWRSAWADFIRERFSPRQLERATVICLPGREVEPEVSEYLALGVRPENIHCVEESLRVRSEFLENTQRLGVRAYPMTLEQALAQCVSEGRHFDIVNFDFHNQFGDEHTQLLEDTPVAEDAIVIYNRLGKREGKDAQADMRRIDAAREEYLARVRSTLAIRGDDETTQELQRRFRLPEQNGLPDFTSESELSNLRQNAMMALPKGAIGSSHVRVDRRRLCEAGMLWLGDSGVDELFDSGADRREICWQLEEVAQSYLWFSTKCLTGLLDTFGKRPGRVLRGCDATTLALVHQHTVFGLSYEVQGSRYAAYHSRTSPDSSPAPFLTSLFRTRRADSVLREHDAALRFCSVWIREQARCNYSQDNRADYTTGSLALFDSRGRLKPSAAPLEWNDVIGVARNRTILDRIQVSDLRLAIEGAVKVAKRDRLVFRM